MKAIRKVFPVVFICALAVTAWISSCEECNDCGILYRDPIVNIKFYNIDSLMKVDSALTAVEDSLDIVNMEIENGNTDLEETKAQLEKIKTRLEKTEQDIKDGKIRIEEVNGIGATEPLYFRDSTTNDSLKVFPFPLSIHDPVSTFLIEIDSRTDTLSLSYQLSEEVLNNFIIMQPWDLNLNGSTYDSTRINCKNEDCISDETTISVYF